MIEITGKVVGMGYMPKTTIAQMQRGGAATYIEIKPEGSKSVVRVRSQHGTDQYNNAGSVPQDRVEWWRALPNVVSGDSGE